MDTYRYPICLKAFGMRSRMPDGKGKTQGGSRILNLYLWAAGFASYGRVIAESSVQTVFADVKKLSFFQRRTFTIHIYAPASGGNAQCSKDKKTQLQEEENRDEIFKGRINRKDRNSQAYFE